MTTYSDTIRFDSVVVLESLAPGERKTGTLLFDEVLKPWSDRDSTFQALINSVGNKAQFLAALEAADNQMFARGRAPILHIEAHGDQDGIRLSNGDVVAWEELRPRLTAINERCGYNLFLVMAMCSGWWLSKLLLPLQPGPVWGLLGPTEPVWDSALLEAMKAFYSELASSLDARKALDAANLNKPYGSWEYLLETAEVMYCRVFHHYVKHLCTSEHLKERENEIVAEIVRRHQYSLEVAFDARDRARHMLANHREFFAFYRHNFFMLDKIPENASRFKLTFDQCVAVI